MREKYRVFYMWERFADRYWLSRSSIRVCAPLASTAAIPFRFMYLLRILSVLFMTLEKDMNAHYSGPFVYW